MVKSSRWVLLAVLALFVALLGVVGCSSGAPTSNTGIALAEEVCSQCHSMTRLYLLEPSRQWDWDTIVPNMVKNHKAGVDGKRLSKEQTADVVNALKTREKSEGELKVQENCTTCHTIEVVAGRYAITMWDDMMNRMATRYGAEFSDEDYALMSEFFANAQ